MDSSKRKKIQALLDNQASSDNEKEICRRLLKENPVDVPIFDPAGEIDLEKLWADRHHRPYVTVISLYRSICQKCRNWFNHKEPGKLYCKLCLKFLQKEADAETDQEG